MQRRHSVLVRCAWASLLLPALAGCRYFTPKPPDHYVYVTAKETYLRDRVAAVSNRVATVSNGTKLTVIERSRRFIQVRTPDGKVGWIDEKQTVDEPTAAKFEDLGKQHEKDSVVADAKAHDEVVMHLGPGREAPFFYRLNENDGVGLLERAVVAKPLPPGQAPKKNDDGTVDPPAMEDWWLARDGKGQTGWVYSRMLDVSVPEALERYAEGQRIVGAYVLTKVEDPESGFVENGQTITTVPVYLTVLGPYKAGLPYDFDQVRVFTWNVKKHRYETGFREKNIAGYLPVQITTATDPYGKGELAQQKLPEFSYQVLPADASLPTPDANGVVKPAKTITKTYRLEGNICRRILAPGTKPPDEAHPVVETKKDAKKKKK